MAPSAALQEPVHMVLLALCQVRDYMQGLNSVDVYTSGAGRQEGLLLPVSNNLVSQCLPCLQTPVVQSAALTGLGMCPKWSIRIGRQLENAKHCGRMQW